jgi:hypothetical protein
LRLGSFDVQSPYGADKTFLAITNPATPVGAAAHRPLATALARRDFLLLAEGSALPPLAEDARSTHARRLFQELPASGAEVRTERHEPAVLRIYRHGEATTLCLINESPWPVEVTLPVEASTPTPWRALGTPNDNAAAPDALAASSSGTWPAGAQTWTVALPPYGVEARRFQTRSLRLGALLTKQDGTPVEVLARRIDEIKQRMASLDVERPYNELQNPDFELLGAAGAIGWQPRVGRTGAVDVDDAQSASGSHSLHLRSEDALGVAEQSQLFPIPATGQLIIRVQARGKDLADDAQLYAWVEYDDGGAARRRCEPLADAAKLRANWTPCEFVVNDLPFGEGGQMRIHFHLAGRGEAWVDNVRLYDLYFPNAQRVELGKWLYAAKSALEQRQLVECQRLVEGYWPRYLLEHVPPTLSTPPLAPGKARLEIATRPEDPAADSPDDGAAAAKDSKSGGRRGLKLFPTWR